LPRHHLPPVHPEHLIAYSVVHHPPEIVAHKPVLAIGALEVELGRGTDVRFTRHQRMYAPESFPHPMHDIFDLVRADSYLVSAEWNRALHSRPQCSSHTLRYEMLRYGLNPRHRPQTHVIRVQERLLRGFAGDFQFSLASPGAAVRTEAEMASNRAQAIWLAWSFLCLSGDPDYDAITAAFRAWRMMNCQHPASETGS
jgi:hypothetical protein